MNSDSAEIDELLLHMADYENDLADLAAEKLLWKCSASWEAYQYRNRVHDGGTPDYARQHVRRYTVVKLDPLTLSCVFKGFSVQCGVFCLFGTFLCGCAARPDNNEEGKRSIVHRLIDAVGSPASFENVWGNRIVG